MASGNKSGSRQFHNGGNMNSKMAAKKKVVVRTTKMAAPKGRERGMKVCK